MVDFAELYVGREYGRPFLANLWGYQSWSAIGRGVFTPRGQSIIVFFVTEEKQESLTQYVDHIDNDILFWEGEKGHGSDSRIIEGKDEIHVFFRKRHHNDFTYMGRAYLLKYGLFESNPSRFSFQLIDLSKGKTDWVADFAPEYVPESTEMESVTKIRIGQTKFRENSIRIWHTCCVSGVTKEPILVASHIKPWKVANNAERLDGYNSLLLVPTYDKLFDKGYVSFDGNGRIIISDKIDMDDVRRCGLDESSHLVEVPERCVPYLEYHQQYVFGLVEERQVKKTT